MTPLSTERDPISASDRTEPLTDAEVRASLHAMQRLLVELRMMAYEKVDHDRIADFVDWIHNMPEMLLKPGFFEDMFRLSLEHLATMRPFCAGILAEYDRAVRGDQGSS
jgi:hypothetical protein